MPTLEELLAFNGSDEDICIISDITRMISIPANVQNLGVESDQDVKRIYFKAPRYVGDNIDLMSLRLYVNYRNAGGEEDAFIVDESETEVVEDNIIFSWLLSRRVTAYKGKVDFIVCGKRVDDGGNLTNEWNTTLAHLNVLEGLEVYAVPTQSEQDIITQLLSLMQESVNEAQGTIGKVTALKEETQSIKESAVTETTKIKDDARVEIQAISDKAVEDTTAIKTATQSIADKAVTDTTKIKTEAEISLKSIADKAVQDTTKIKTDALVETEAVREQAVRDVTAVKVAAETSTTEIANKAKTDTQAIANKAVEDTTAVKNQAVIDTNAIKASTEDLKNQANTYASDAKKSATEALASAQNAEESANNVMSVKQANITTAYGIIDNTVNASAVLTKVEGNTVHTNANSIDASANILDVRTWMEDIKTAESDFRYILGGQTEEVLVIKTPTYNMWKLQFKFASTEEEVTVSYDEAYSSSFKNLRIEILNNVGTEVNRLYLDNTTKSLTATGNKIIISYTAPLGSAVAIKGLRINKGSTSYPWKPYASSVKPRMDYPVPIKGIGSKGFFDGILEQGYWSETTGLFVPDSAQVCGRNKIICEKDDILELQYYGALYKLRILWYNDKDGLISNDVITLPEERKKHVLSGIAPEGTKYCRISIISRTGSSLKPENTGHICLLKNNKYAVKIKTMGVNLVNPDELEISAIDTANGRKSTNEEVGRKRITTGYMRVNGSSLGVLYNKEKFISKVVCYYDENYRYLGISSVVEKFAKYVRVVFSRVVDTEDITQDDLAVMRSTLHIQNGTDATYEPYSGSEITIVVDKPIYEGDTLGIKDGKYGVYRAKEQDLLDGSSDEDWREYQNNLSGAKTYYLPFGGTDIGWHSSDCDYFTNVEMAWNNKQFESVYSDYVTSGNLSKYFNVKDTITTIADFRTWLSSHPITVVYTLAKQYRYFEQLPIAVQQDMFGLRTVDGKTNIYIQDAVTGNMQLDIADTHKSEYALGAYARASSERGGTASFEGYITADQVEQTNDRKFVTSQQIANWNTKYGSGDLPIPSSVTATKLATPRYIGGTLFDGTKDISPIKFDSIAIAEGTDLNTIKTQGYYVSMGNSNTGTLKNAPFGNTSFGLQVIYSVNGSTEYIVQMAYRYNSESSTTFPTIKRRSYDAYTWSEWEQLYTTTNKPTKADVGLANVDNTADVDKAVKISKTMGNGDMVMTGTSNEINFGGTNLSSTINFGYSVISGSNRPRITDFVFGNKTADVHAKGFVANNGGKFTGDLVGNADTATKLKTPRLIGGTIFDGTANILPTQFLQTLIAKNSDLNNYKTNGYYVSGNSTDSATIKNKPFISQISFALIVYDTVFVNSVDYKIQLAYALHEVSGGSMAYRIYNVERTPQWTSWVYVYDTLHKPTLTELGIPKVQNTADSEKVVNRAVNLGSETNMIIPTAMNELNFGGTSTNTSLYIGYTKQGNRPVPTEYFFGGAGGTYANITAKTIIAKDVLRGNLDGILNGGKFTQTAIPANAKLNEYMTTGFYVCGDNSVAVTVVNRPFEGNSFALLILKGVRENSNYTIQVAYNYDTMGQSNIRGSVAHRVCGNTGTWLPWVYQYDTEHKPTKADIGLDKVSNLSPSEMSVLKAKTADSATTATKLSTARTINTVAFDGTKNIEITANPYMSNWSGFDFDDLKSVSHGVYYTSSSTVVNAEHSPPTYGDVIMRVFGVGDDRCVIACAKDMQSTSCSMAYRFYDGSWSQWNAVPRNKYDIGLGEIENIKQTRWDSRIRLEVPKSLITNMVYYDSGCAVSSISVNLVSSLGLSGRNLDGTDWREKIELLGGVLIMGTSAPEDSGTSQIITQGITDYGGGIKSGVSWDGGVTPMGMIQATMKVGSYDDANLTNFKNRVQKLLLDIRVVESYDAYKVANNNAAT